MQNVDLTQMVGGGVHLIPSIIMQIFITSFPIPDVKTLSKHFKEGDIEQTLQNVTQRNYSGQTPQIASRLGK